MVAHPGSESFALRDLRLWPIGAAAYLVAIPLVALAYAGVASISLALAIPPGYASAVWPPAGIALAAWLAFGPRIWPGILLGATLANLGVAGTPPAVALAIGIGNTAEAAVAGLLLYRHGALRHQFDSPAMVWLFAAVAFGAALIAATGGVSTLALAGQVPWEEFGRHWLTWWLGDATGLVIVAPLLLAWSEPAGRGPADQRLERRLFTVLLLMVGAIFLALHLPAETVQRLAYLMIPLVTWAAARLDQKAVTAASFAISAVAILDMLDGTATLFARVPSNESLILLQLFVSAVALSGLTLSAFAAESARANRLLVEARADLERRVAERTAELRRALTEQRQLARRIAQVRDEERARLSADLHDGAAQELSALGVALEAIRTGHALRDAGWLEARVGEAHRSAQRAGTALRALIAGLRLPGLEGAWLGESLRRLAAEFEARTGILVSVYSTPGREMLPLRVKEVLLRIFQEALANAARHADAHSIRVTLESTPSGTRFAVEDDGRGFDPAVPAAGAGSGLQIMRERAMAVGAELHVRSTPGAGTRIELILS